MADAFYMLVTVDQDGDPWVRLCHLMTDVMESLPEMKAATHYPVKVYAVNPETLWRDEIEVMVEAPEEAD